MSVESRMIHRITVERATDGAEDEYGQPAQTWAPMLVNVPAFIVTKSAREVALLSQGGAVISAVTIGLPAGTGITEADRIHHDPATCPVPAGALELPDVTYQLSGARDASGAGIYVRCDAQEVT